MKLSKIRPDMVTNPTNTPKSEYVDAVKNHNGDAVMVNPSSTNETTDHRTNMEQTTEWNYDTQPQKYVRARIVQINEAMAQLQAEGDTILEWEAANMLITELELVLENDPQYLRPQ